MTEKIDDTTVEKIEKGFWDHIQSLSPELRNFIASPTTIQSVRRIGKECELSDADIVELLDEVGLTLIGFGPPLEFKMRLAERLPNPEKVELIANRIDEELFAHVHNELDSLYKETSDEKPKPNETTPAPEIFKGGVEQSSLTPPLSPPPPEAPLIVPQPEKAPIPNVRKWPEVPFPEVASRPPMPEWKPEEHLITPHPSLPGERPDGATQLFTVAPQQKSPTSIFEQKVSDFYKAPKENGASGEIKDPYREPTV